MTTALIWDERFFWFDAGGSMPPLPGCEPYPAFDRPDTKRRIKSLLDASGLIDHLAVLEKLLVFDVPVDIGPELMSEFFKGAEKLCNIDHVVFQVSFEAVSDCFLRDVTLSWCL